MKNLLIGLALIACPAIVFAIFGIAGLEVFFEDDNAAPGRSPIEEGRLAFATECAGCHGRMAEGTGRGPALIDPVWGPSRFGDDAFRRAVREGVPSRLWRFGDMPAFPDLPEREVDRILAFVRQVQRTQGVW